MEYEQLKLDNQLCFGFTRQHASRWVPITLILIRLASPIPQYLVLLVLWEQDKQP
jgi:transcriptional regulator, MarR family